MIVPALLTLATGVVTYATRGPVSQLSTGKKYKVVAYVNPGMYPAGDITKASSDDVSKLIAALLTGSGFNDVSWSAGQKPKQKSVKMPDGSSATVLEYDFVGTWSRTDKTVTSGPLAAASNWVGVSFYATLF